MRIHCAAVFMICALICTACGSSVPESHSSKARPTPVRALPYEEAEAKAFSEVRANKIILSDYRWTRKVIARTHIFKFEKRGTANAKGWPDRFEILVKFDGTTKLLRD